MNARKRKLKSTTIFKNRLRGVFVFLIVIAILLLINLFHIQVSKGETFRNQADSQYVVATYNAFERGSIFFKEKDNTFSVSVSKSLSERFLYITTESTDQSEEYFIDANAPSKNPTLFFSRQPNHEYTITDGENHFYIVTNDNAINFKLMETPIDRISKENWRIVVPHRDDVLLKNVSVLKDYIVLEEVDNGLARIATIDRRSDERRLVEFDESVYTISVGDNYEYDTKSFRFVFE